MSIWVEDTSRVSAPLLWLSATPPIFCKLVVGRAPQLPVFSQTQAVDLVTGHGVFLMVTDGRRVWTSEMEGNTILSYVEGMETPSLEAIYTLLTDAMRFVDVPGRHAALKLITEGEEDKLALICSVSISSMRSIEVTLPLTLQDAEVAHEVIMRNVVLPSVLGHSVLASCFDTQIETLPIDQRAAIHRSLKTDCRRLPPLQVCSVDGVLELPSSAFLTERNRVSDLSRGVQQALCFRSCPTSPPSDPAGTLVRNVKTVDVVKNSSVVSRNIRKGLRRSKRS